MGFVKDDASLDRAGNFIVHDTHLECRPVFLPSVCPGPRDLAADAAGGPGHFSLDHTCDRRPGSSPILRPGRHCFSKGLTMSDKKWMDDADDEMEPDEDEEAAEDEDEDAPDDTDEDAEPEGSDDW